MVQNIRYCSFGRLLEEANPGFPMPLGFAGGLHDRDVGWVRFGFRDYDPETGRFTAPDPMGYAAGDPDVYGYCLDDPVNNVDPAGLQSDEITWMGDGRSILDGPKSGNWCGKNWSGGWNPKEHGGRLGLKSPTSTLDEYYKDHDNCYAGSKNKDDKEECDKTLVNDLKTLHDDPIEWNNPPYTGTEGDATLMKKGAIWWFD